jgi:hypothetical protein
MLRIGRGPVLHIGKIKETPMKLVIALVATLALSQAAFAGAQQNKMKDCNVAAKGKKGDERKAFMKTCLSAKSVAATTAAPVSAAAKSADPKQRMKDCNTQGKGKKGDERKAFMSSCLKN